MRATFNTTYNASDSKKTVQGVVESILLIDLTGQKPEIVSVKSKTISRRELVASK